MRITSLQQRLTVWYTATLLAILAAYAAGVVLLLGRSLRQALDHHLAEDLAVAFDLIERRDGGFRWRSESPYDGGYDAGERRWIEIWSEGGERLFVRGSEGAALIQAMLAPPRADRLGFATLRLPDGRQLRVLTTRRAVGGLPVLMRVARVDTTRTDQLRPALGLLALGLPIAAGAALGVYLIARRTLAPVTRMAALAEAISAEHLDIRLPAAEFDAELARLAMSFNCMFDRLERSFAALRQFTAAASHELRTPLTALRSVGEVGLREPRSPEAYRDIICSMLEETDRLGRLVDNLLMLSRSDASGWRVSRATVDLSRQAREVAGLLGVLAEERHQTLTVDAEPEILVRGDPVLLRQALLNLVDNAIKYSPAQATIRIVAAQNASSAVVEVIDQGPGIPAEYRDRVFEPFCRLDPARASDTGGAGLGLFIARRAVEAHGGRLELESTPGRGCRFRVVLPPASRAQGLETHPGLALAGQLPPRS